MMIKYGIPNSGFGMQKKNVAFGKVILVLGLLLLLVGVGCGYHFSGQGPGFPKDVRTVFVNAFVNKTREVGMDMEIASALRSEFHRQGQLRVVDQVSQADAILSGVVRSLDRRVLSVNRENEVLQFQLALVVDVNLRRRIPDEILWRTRGTRLTEVYSGSRGAVVTTSSEFKTGTLDPRDVPRFTDIQITETLSHDAKVRLVERFAREVHQRLMEMF
ncbi:MAG: LPS assembly lipoprotein LptE [Candidatus Binatia bacterium]